jgi:hypothetical protein
MRVPGGHIYSMPQSNSAVFAPDAAAPAPPDAGAGVDLGAPNTWTAPQTFEAGLVLPPCTFAELPPSPAYGTRGLITDAAASSFNGMVTAGGGTVVVTVFYDGDMGVWRMG